MTRIVASLLLLFLAEFAFADTYYWTHPDVPGQFSSAVAVCQKLDGRRYSTNAHYEYRKVTFLSATQANCRMAVVRDSDGFVINPDIGLGNASRFGNTCGDGQYDPAIGGCVIPVGEAGQPCDGPDFFGMPSVYNSQGVCVTWDKADKPASCKYLASRGSQPTVINVSFSGDGEPQKPQTEKLGCEVDVVSVAHCKMPVPKCGSGICVELLVSKCQVHVNFTGNTAGEPGDGYPVSGGPDEEGVCPAGVDCLPKPEPVVEESKPCNYMYNGQVVSCESSEFKGDPGEMNCGRVNNGPYTCTKKVPKSTGVDIRTKITTEPTADGGTKTTKEDEHTKTVCSAPGSCTTQITNNKTTIVKDSGGKTVSETGECTGALCDGNGNGKTPSKGGNCQPGEQCGNEEEGGSFSGPENGEVPGFGESLQSFKDKVAGAPIIAGINAIQMPAGGSCSMSSASTMIGTISGDTVCQNSGWLDPLYYVFLAMGALNAVRILMSA